MVSGESGNAATAIASTRGEFLARDVNIRDVPSSNERPSARAAPRDRR